MQRGLRQDFCGRCRAVVLACCHVLHGEAYSEVCKICQLVLAALALGWQGQGLVKHSEYQSMHASGIVFRHGCVEISQQPCLACADNERHCVASGPIACQLLLLPSVLPVGVQLPSASLSLQ